VVGGSDGLVVGLMQSGGMPGTDAVYRIRPKSLVIAMGSTERPIAFTDNDRPGVMLMGAGERYLVRYGVRVGEDVVLFGNHDRLYATARRLLDGGVRVRAIVDTRAELHGRAVQSLHAELVRSGVNCLLGHAVLGTTGLTALTGTRVAPLAAPNAVPHARLRRVARQRRVVAQRARCCTRAASQPMCRRLRHSMRADSPRGVSAAGRPTANWSLRRFSSMGYSAAARRRQIAGLLQIRTRHPWAAAIQAQKLEPFWRSPAPRAQEKRQFVDLQNDVTVADLRQASRRASSISSMPNAIRTLALEPIRADSASVLALRLSASSQDSRFPRWVSFARGHRISRSTLIALTGHRFASNLQPTQRTALHAWHEAHGGVLEAAGLWLRSRYYRANGEEAFAAGLVEAARVRAHGVSSTAQRSARSKSQVSMPRSFWTPST